MKIGLRLPLITNAAAAVSLILGAAAAHAQEGGLAGADASEVARQTSNPLGGDFMVLINEWHYTSNDGKITDKNRASFTHVFQPVVPISMDFIGEHWILVNRPTLPIIYDAEIPAGVQFSGDTFAPDPGNTFRPGTGGRPSVQFRNHSGIADISHFSLLGVSLPSENALLGRGDTVLAGGFSINIPAGHKEFTTNYWAAGPAGVAAYIGEKGILGALVQTQFDFATSGKSASGGYDVMFMQPFYYLNLNDGWQVGGAPLLKFDFNTYEHDIPIGLGIQKTQIFDLGNGAKLPVRFGIEGRVNVASNDFFGSDYSVVFSISPIIPNIVQNLIRGCSPMTVGGC